MTIQNFKEQINFFNTKQIMQWTKHCESDATTFSMFFFL